MTFPQGGTELTRLWLHEVADKDLLDAVNIVSRPDDYKDGAKNVLWVHDLPADMPFLSSAASRQLFDGIVFVSSWQQTVFFMNMGVPYSESTVLRNAIHPINGEKKTASDEVRIIYHPTPHRGLEVLVPVFMSLCERYDNIHLDVYSNFDIYARPEANKPYEQLYEQCRSHPKIAYHGSQPNEVVREALLGADIFAYPCIWRETSCISAMEAMSAGCLIVAPDYSALPETLANFNISYSWTEDVAAHAGRFAAALSSAIESVEDKSMRSHLADQKKYADKFYSWERRASEWNTYLKEVVSAPRKKRGGLQWN